MEDKKDLVPFEESEGYQALVEECQAIITEGVWNEKMERILTFGRLGERVATDSLYKKFEKGNTDFLKKVASDVGFSFSNLYRAIQFYDKFQVVSPDSEGWSKFKEGKNISWNKIKTFYLPEDTREKCGHNSVEKVEMFKCKDCGRVFTKDPNVKE